jgi:two-component system cell cycle sensor histidine kinase/response regulator CckA
MAGAPRREPEPPHGSSPLVNLKPRLSVEQSSESLLRRVVRDSPCGIAAVGLDRRFLTVNPVFCAQAGGDPATLAGTDGVDLLAPELVAALHHAFEVLQDDDRENAGFEWLHPGDDGLCSVQYTVSLVRDRAGAPLFYVVIGNDMTEARHREDEQRRQTDELHNAEKLESLERLASGTAHDFNNLLLGMIGQAELALLDLPPDHSARDALVEIVKIGFRAADHCRQLLAYCGKGDLKLAPLNLSDLVRDLAPLLEASLGGLRPVLRLAEDLPAVAGDATQLRQAVLDLVNYAAEAMRGRSGSIELSTGLYERGPGELKDVATGRDLPAGLYVRFEVRDSGCGVPDDQLAHIFDPFYTTTFAGRGLGLASVVGVVRSHLGALTATSKVGEGTTVSVDLPVAVAATTPELPPVSTPGISAEAGDRPAHVLVVDDEELVRRVSTRLLETAGYRVTSSPDGYLALELFGSEPGSFDLVLLDMTMPGISGLEALERIRQYRPSVPVLLTSGFSEREVSDVLAHDRACRFIQKPYTAAALQRQIAAMLRSRAETGAGC